MSYRPNQCKWIAQQFFLTPLQLQLKKSRLSPPLGWTAKNFIILFNSLRNSKVQCSCYVLINKGNQFRDFLSKYFKLGGNMHFSSEASKYLNKIEWKKLNQPDGFQYQLKISHPSPKNFELIKKWVGKI